MKKRIFLFVVGVFLASGIFLQLVFTASAMDLAPFEKAHINWRRCEGQTITVAFASHPLQRALEPLVGDFERLTGIKVKFDVYKDPDLMDKLLMDLSTRTGKYDAFMVLLYFIPTWAGQDWLENLYPYVHNPQLTDEKWYDLSDVYPGLLEFGKGNELSQPVKWGKPDKLYGMPMTAEGCILYHRKDLFEQYGLQLPKTWDEVYDTAGKLTIDEDGDGNADIFGYEFRYLRAVGHNTHQWSHLLFSYGGSWFDENWYPGVNSPEAIKALEMFVKLGDYGPIGAQNFGFAETLAFMAEGKVAMWLDMGVGQATLEDPSVSKVAGKIGYAPPPAGPAGAKVSGWTWTVAINASSKYKEAAWLFLQWASSKPTALAGVMQTGTPRASVAANPLYAKLFPNDWIQSSDIALGPQHLVSCGAPLFPKSMELMDTLSGKLGEATLRIKPPKQALDEVATVWRRIMDKLGYYK